jgi:hypothetical protein
VLLYPTRVLKKMMTKEINREFYWRCALIGSVCCCFCFCFYSVLKCPCFKSLESVRSAIDGGAHRLELCASLVAGGLTPSAGFVRKACLIAKEAKIPWSEKKREAKKKKKY